MVDYSTLDTFKIHLKGMLGYLAQIVVLPGKAEPDDP